MRFTVASKEFLTLLQQIGKLLPSAHASTPALTNYLIKVSPERLSVTGGDSMIRSTGVIPPLSCDGEISLLVPPTPMIDYIKSLPAQPLTFDVEMRDAIRVMRIAHQGGYIDIPLGDPDLYVSSIDLAVSNNQTTLRMKTDQLLRGLSFCQQCAHQDPAYTQFNGVYFAFKPDRLEMCGTDSRQLVRFLDYDGQHMDSDQNVPLEPPSFLMPLKLTSFLQTLLPVHLDEEVILDYVQERLYLRFGAFEIISQISTVRFPDYNQILPDTMDHIVTIEREAILKAAGRVNALTSIAGLGADASLLNFTFVEGKMILTGSFYSEGVNAPGADAQETFPMEYPADMEGMKISLPGHSFMRFLKAFDVELLQIQINTPTAAIMVLPAEQEEKVDLRGIIMPIRQR